MSRSALFPPRKVKPYLCQLVKLPEHLPDIISELIRGTVWWWELPLELGSDQSQVDSVLSLLEDGQDKNTTSECTVKCYRSPESAMSQGYLQLHSRKRPQLTQQASSGQLKSFLVWGKTRKCAQLIFQARNGWEVWRDLCSLSHSVAEPFRFARQEVHSRDLSLPSYIPFLFSFSPAPFRPEEDNSLNWLPRSGSRAY